MDRSKRLTLKQAAGIAGVSPDTIARWCKRYGIGRQLHRNAPWRVDPVGLAIISDGDQAALAKYQRGD
ncbi:helix-turn-helix domain-containing protein [Aminobacter sp. UC22_36]|uniref:helix-turn-helix domain-containing protein n=1 Tax=Aminobacter sp. UC22_36 TaxID=3374549 RepID=UPI0037574FB7